MITLLIVSQELYFDIANTRHVQSGTKCERSFRAIINLQLPKKPQLVASGPAGEIRRRRPLHFRRVSFSEYQIKKKKKRKK